MGKDKKKSQLATENKATKNCQDSLCPGHKLNQQALSKYRTQSLHLSQPVQCSISNMAMKVLLAVADIYCCGSSCFIVLAAAAAATAVVLVVVVVFLLLLMLVLLHKIYFQHLTNSRPCTFSDYVFQSHICNGRP